jgi:DNA polymerase-3 subunit gamma/tau
LRKLVTLIGKQDLSGSLGVLNELTMDGKDIKQILIELTEYLRALLLFKAKAGYEDIYLTDTAEAFAPIADLYTSERILAATSRIHKALEEIRFSARERIVAELCLFDLCHIQGDTVEALTARVAQLEKRLAGVSGVSAAYQTMPSHNELTETVTQASQKVPDEPDEKLESTSSTAKSAEGQMPSSGTTEAATPKPAIAAVNGVELWSEICRALKSRRKRTILAYAEMGTVLALTPEKLTVGFSTETSKDRMEEPDYKNVLLDIIKELTGKPLSLEFVEKAGLEPTQIKVAPTKPRQAAPAQKSPAAKELPKDVKQALDVFGGSLEKA